jgi:FkbM family methyltransferase
MIDIPLASAIRMEGLALRLSLPAWVWRGSTQFLRRISRRRGHQRQVQSLRETRHIDPVTALVKDADAWRRCLQEPLRVLDVGARGGPLPAFCVFEEVLHLTLVEPDPHEARRLRRDWGRNCAVLAIALGATDTKATLHVTRNPGGSSLLAPDGDGVVAHVKRSRRSDASRFEVDEEIPVPVTSLQQLSRQESTHFEILKVDTQGSEGPIIQGLGVERPLLIQLELTDDIPIYRGEWPASRVLQIVHSMGYITLRRPRSRHGDWILLRDPQQITSAAGAERALIACCVMGVAVEAAHALAGSFKSLPLAQAILVVGNPTN